MSDQPMMFKDGVWIPAQPMAFYQDTRPWFVRLWHAFLVARGCDEDELLEPWYVPVPPGTKTDRMRG